jgi:hypothetical protein
MSTDRMRYGDEYCPMECDKRLDRLETKQDVIFDRIKAIEIYVNVKKATNHVNDIEKEKKENYWLKIRFMIFGIFLTLTIAILEQIISHLL